MFNGCQGGCVGIHQFIVVITTSLSVLSIIPQSLKLQKLKSPLALSFPGLAIQTVVFTLLGVSWLIRTPELEVGTVTWYTRGGWAAIGNFVFAAVQVLLLMYGSWVCRDQTEEGSDERTPLLM